MQFELTEALIDDILFSMEDQEGEFHIDTQDGVVAGGPDFNDTFSGEDNSKEGRYVDLPEWDSSDGFRLMERFAAGFRNPLIREDLSAALNQGRGVFRAFKNVLGRYPEVEKVWFAFKEREMKKRIINWYNALREEWGLEKIGHEPEETGDLIHEDFRFRGFRKEDISFARELHAICEKETGAEKLYFGRPLDEESLLNGPAFSAESGSGEFAGFIGALPEGNAYHVHYLEVRPEFRGLGIGEVLLVRFLESIDSRGSEVYMELPSSAEGFSRVLAREGFKPCMTRYRLDTKDRSQ